MIYVYLRMAWRNIWRNPRRTTVVMCAIIIGVWSMVFLGSLMRGMLDNMVKNGIDTLTGHIQIHHKGYRNDPVIENSIVEPERLEIILKQILPLGTQWTSRVKINAIANNARHSGRVTLVGIDPEQEALLSFIGKAVKQGSYLKPDDEHGVIVGRALVDKFETKLNRKLIIMSQDTNNEIVSSAFRIIGIFEAPNESAEKQFVFVTKHAAQKMLKMKNHISEISIILKNQKKINQIVALLKDKLSSVHYEVHMWKEILSYLSSYLKIFESFIFLWYMVAFIAMGFGIINTMLMAVFERIHEFGIFKALGVKSDWIVKEVLTESFLLLIIGMTLGNILGFLNVFLFSKKGIDLSSLAAGTEFIGMSRVIYPVIYNKDVLLANIIVFILGILISLYPAVKAAVITPVEALVHN